MASEHRELGSSLFGSEPWQPIRVRAVIAVVAIAVAVAVDVVDLIATWRMVDSYAGYVDGSVSIAELRAASEFVDALARPLLVLNLVAGLAFLVWMWRAYNNAKFFGGEDSQRRVQGWVVFGWIVPVVNLWFPNQMMSDIWRASPVARLTRTAPIVGWWWAVYLVATLAGLVLRFFWNDQDTANLAAMRNLELGYTVLWLVAGVLICLIIKRITAWQNEVRDA